MNPKKVGLLFVVLAVLLPAACGDPESGGSEAAADGCPDDVVTTDSGLQYKDLECGDGDEAKAGDRVTVHYTGTLEDGTKFDSSRDRGQPFDFTLGAGDVIPGWDEGIEGMTVGTVRELTIPPDLAYGEGGFPPTIPPNATLVFEVELLEVASSGA